MAKSKLGGSIKWANEKKNLSFVLVQAKANLEKKMLPTTKVTWTLRTPIDPGTYTITAAFLYGTEEPDEMKTGKLEDSAGRPLRALRTDCLL